MFGRVASRKIRTNPMVLDLATFVAITVDVDFAQIFSTSIPGSVFVVWTVVYGELFSFTNVATGADHKQSVGDHAETKEYTYLVVPINYERVHGASTYAKNRFGPQECLICMAVG